MANPTRISELSAAPGGLLAGDQIPIARGAGSTGQTYRAFASQFLTTFLSAVDTPTIDLDFNTSTGVLKADTKDGLIVSDTPPLNPLNGQLWFDSSSGITSVFYDNTWVDVGGGEATTTLNTVNSPTINLSYNSATETLSANLNTSSLTTILSSSLSASPMVAKAWVSFNGTGTNGSKTPTSSYNVSSVTRFAAGRYKITFTDTLASDPKVSGAGEIWMNTSRGLAFSILARETANSYVAGNTGVTTSYVWIQLTSVDSDPGIIDSRTITVLVF